MKYAEIATSNMVLKNTQSNIYSKIVLNQYLQQYKNQILRNIFFLSLIKDISIHDKSTWPSSVNTKYSREEDKRLCKRFMLNKNPNIF